MVGSRLGVVCCMRGCVRADVRLALPILGLLKNTGQPGPRDTPASAVHQRVDMCVWAGYWQGQWALAEGEEEPA